MNTINQVTLTAKELAKKWCEYNGQKGTDKQIEVVLKRFKDIEMLYRMLKERGQV